LEQKHKLIRSYETKYKFDHAKIKEVLYNKIPTELRMEYHAIIADTIETLNKSDLKDVMGDLAFHYYHSKNSEKALPYLIKAARQAKEDYSNDEAIRFYSEALELEEDPENRAKIFEEKGDIYELIGDYDKSIESYKMALELTKKKNKIAEIKTKISHMYFRKGEHDESLKLSNEALDLVKGKECKEEALAINAIGNVHWLKGEYDKAVEEYEKSLKIREKIHDMDGIATSLHNIGILHYWREDYEKALEYLEKSKAISEKNDSLYSLSYCLLSIGYVYEHTQEYDKALKIYENTIKIIERIGSLREMSWYYSNIAEVYFRTGDLKKAFDFCNLTFDISNKIHAKESIGNAKYVLGMIYREQKKWKESIENFEANIRILKDFGDRWHLGDSLYEFGLMWKAKGDSEKAKSYLSKAQDVFTELKLNKHAKKVKAALDAL
jgi:tetratricopeptide (TPR) repeat protein